MDLALKDCVLARIASRTGRKLFSSAAGRTCFLEFLQFRAAAETAGIHGYCLLHLQVLMLVQPSSPASLARLLGQTQRDFSGWAGEPEAEMWDRTAVFTPDSPWLALREIELAPVQMGLVQRPENWPWSSARAHLGLGEPHGVLSTAPFCEQFSHGQWSLVLHEGMNLYPSRLQPRREWPSQMELWRKTAS